jgi:hypothetical protein
VAKEAAFAGHGRTTKTRVLLSALELHHVLLAAFST